MISVIKDYKDVNNLLTETLRKAGFETESAYTGRDALELIHNNKYEMILLDMMHPVKCVLKKGILAIDTIMEQGMLNSLL